MKPIVSKQSNHDDELTVERLERALFTVSQVVAIHGPVYAPIMRRIERELELAREGDPVKRSHFNLEKLRARTKL